MGKVWSFWIQCIREAAKGASPFANDWQWIFGIPLWTWLTGTSLFAGVVGNATGMITGRPWLDTFLAAAAAFILTWLIAFVSRAFSLAAARYDEANGRAVSAEQQIAELLNEYAHSLQLLQIDQEDRRQVDKETKTKVIGRQIRFMIRLRNALGRPIRYTVTGLDINGVMQPAVATAGGVIAANSPATYYSHWIEMPVDSLDDVYNARMILDIEYGHPDKAPSRAIHKEVNLELLPANQGLHMLYEVDTDVPRQIPPA